MPSEYWVPISSSMWTRNSFEDFRLTVIRRRTVYSRDGRFELKKPQSAVFFFSFGRSSTLVRIKISIRHVTTRAYGNTRSREASAQCTSIYNMHTWQRHDFTLETVFALTWRWKYNVQKSCRLKPLGRET